MKKLTKIVATISDKNCAPDFIYHLFEAGLNVVRMNSAHLGREGFEKIVNSVRSVSPTIGILIDTKGPEIRTTTNVDDKPIMVADDMKVTFTGDPAGTTTPENICLTYPDIAADVKAGDHLLIDDGELDFHVDGVDGGVIYATAQNSGSLGSRKSVNIPGASINLPSLSDRDKKNIEIAAELGVDFVAHSFVRSREDVEAVQAHLDAIGSTMKIISKIENQQGVDNFDEILDASYGIMIARGDLGIEVAAELIPGIQKRLINKCVEKHKPVIVATQMLHSMISNPRPTRAEVSDIANAVYQHADALMLSGETAYGRYPVEALSTMARVAKAVEASLASQPATPDCPEPLALDVTSFLARQAVESGTMLGTRAILTDSYTGRTARFISSFRGIYPTMAICYRPDVVRLLALSYGVLAFYRRQATSSRLYLRRALEAVLEKGLLGRDDRIAYLGGGFGEGHGTSFLEINKVGEILDNYATYCLPNLEDVEQKCSKTTNR